MKRSYNKYTFFLTLILTCQYAHGTHLVKRDDDDSGMLDPVKNLLGNIPYLGASLSSVVEDIQELYQKLQELTNGAFGRLLGGAFPCTIALETGLICTGVTTKSSISDIVRQLLDPVPGLMLPEFVKNLVYMSVDGLVVPGIDVFLGGVRMKEAES